MFDIIIAHNLNFGIGMQGKIPWHCTDDLKLFKQLTTNSILIMGRKTVENLPHLPERTVFCLSSKETVQNDKNNSRIFKTLQQALQEAEQKYPEKTVFVAGGAEIYKLALTTAKDKVRDIHISIVEDKSECDVTFPIYDYIEEFVIAEKFSFPDLSYYLLRKENDQEKQYLNLLKEILENGTERNTRNGQTKSLFHKNMTFDLRKGFPLLTTKKMFFKGIVEELLFFIRGNTDSKLLEAKGVNIWRGNTDREFLDKIGKKNRKEGIMGPLYGYQWRFFNAKYDEKTGKPLEQGMDQLKLVIETIKNDPNSRRIIMTDFNPLQVDQGVLYPCHSILIQFYVTDNFLDMYCYNRSQDTFLGTPFNIASSALFLTLISKVTNLTPRYLHMGLGDVHIYRQHYEQVKTQIERIPYIFPNLILKKEIKTLSELENLSTEDISIKNYRSYPTIKAEMVA